jgi:hypothetical protein
MTVFQHCVIISFGLEGHMMGMPRSVYEEITATDKPGPNKQASKAEKLRVYPIPEKYRVMGSSPKKGERTLYFYLAVISPTYVYVLEDFARLARLWWKSRTRKWLPEDITTDGSVSRW